jgi:hypothetical protein
MVGVLWRSVPTDEYTVGLGWFLQESRVCNVHQWFKHKHKHGISISAYFYVSSRVVIINIGGSALGMGMPDRVKGALYSSGAHLNLNFRSAWLI